MNSREVNFGHVQQAHLYSNTRKATQKYIPERLDVRDLCIFSFLEFSGSLFPSICANNKDQLLAKRKKKNRVWDGKQNKGFCVSGQTEFPVIRLGSTFDLLVRQ